MATLTNTLSYKGRRCCFFSFFVVVFSAMWHLIWSKMASHQIFLNLCDFLPKLIWLTRSCYNTGGSFNIHYSDVIMSTMVSQIASLTIVYSTVYSGADQKISKLRVTGLCAGHSPETGELPAQRASRAENVSIWWRHHAKTAFLIIEIGIIMTEGDSLIRTSNAVNLFMSWHF